jgi:hypothetical protein
MSCTITADEFKDYFDRGQFTYSEDLPDVRDKDIESAIAEALAVFNGDLYPDSDICKQALYYLTAHFLQSDIEAADSGGQGQFLQNSRSADGISESVNIPEWILKGELAIYATTYYGLKWLLLSKPYMDGAVYSVPGGTQF